MLTICECGQYKTIEYKRNKNKENINKNYDFSLQLLW